MNYSLVTNKNIFIDEILVNEFFGQKTDGFFVELGANNGTFQSNTKKLESEYNWSGILIEPCYEDYKKCLKSRKAKCYNCACVSYDYNKDTILGDFKYSNPMSSINGVRSNCSDLIEVNAKTLDSILEENNITHIDLLSLDVEGYEYEVLNGIDFNKRTIKYLLIEIYLKDFDKIVNFLSKFGYHNHKCLTNYNKLDNPKWDGTHNDYIFCK
jgi:FkbM family methyltransferase